jgi:hypothetical protein
MMDRGVGKDGLSSSHGLPLMPVDGIPPQNAQLTGLRDFDTRQSDGGPFKEHHVGSKTRRVGGRITGDDDLPVEHTDLGNK